MEYPRTTKNVGQPCVICRQPSNAQATVEALRKELAQEQALNTVRRDAWWQSVKELETALDAEREKVKELEANQAEYEKCTDEQITALNQGCLDYEKELTQLRALVRAAVERWRAQTNVKEGISFRMAMKELEAALTPVEGGQDE